MKKDIEFTVFNRLLEMFGTPVGMLPPGPLVGVRDERESTDLNCSCGSPSCSCDDDVCLECGNVMYEDGCSECGSIMTFGEAKDRKKSKSKKSGPDKKTAQKILKGTKTFKEKVKKVSGWAEKPEAAAAWMQHKATGKWPSEK